MDCEHGAGFDSECDACDAKSYPTICPICGDDKAAPNRFCPHCQARVERDRYKDALEAIVHVQCKTRDAMHPCLYGGRYCDICRAALKGND